MVRKPTSRNKPARPGASGKAASAHPSHRGRPPNCARRRAAWTPAEIEEAFCRFRSASPERRASSSTSIRIRCWLPSCCRRKRPMPVSTRRPVRSSPSPIRRPGWSRSAKRVCASTSRRSGSTTPGQERHCAVPAAARSARRPSAARSRGAEPCRASAARLPTSSSTLRSASLRLRSTPRLPRRQPDRACARRHPFESRRARAGHPRALQAHAHHWLILHGRYICKAGKPACDRCLIADLCKCRRRRARRRPASRQAESTPLLDQLSSRSRQRCACAP